MSWKWIDLLVAFYVEEPLQHQSEVSAKLFWIGTTSIYNTNPVHSKTDKKSSVYAVTLCNLVKLVFAVSERTM